MWTVNHCVEFGWGFSGLPQGRDWRTNLKALLRMPLVLCGGMTGATLGTAAWPGLGTGLGILVGEMAPDLLVPSWCAVPPDPAVPLRAELAEATEESAAHKEQVDELQSELREVEQAREEDRSRTAALLQAAEVQLTETSRRVHALESRIDGLERENASTMREKAQVRTALLLLLRLLLFSVSLMKAPMLCQDRLRTSSRNKLKNGGVSDQVEREKAQIQAEHAGAAAAIDEARRQKDESDAKLASLTQQLEGSSAQAEAVRAAKDELAAKTAELLASKQREEEARHRQAQAEAEAKEALGAAATRMEAALRKEAEAAAAAAAASKPAAAAAAAPSAGGAGGGGGGAAGAGSKPQGKGKSKKKR